MHLNLSEFNNLNNTQIDKSNFDFNKLSTYSISTETIDGTPTKKNREKLSKSKKKEAPPECKAAKSVQS